MSQLLRLLKSNKARELPLSAIFPSNAVMDVDATIAASYSSGQVWKNLIKAPADGAAQTDYDWNRGANNTVTTDDPTFVGSPGSASSYWSLDGGDLFSLANTPSTFLGNLHKRIAHTFITTVRFQPGASADLGLFSTTDTLNTANVGMAYSCGFNFGFYRQRETTNQNNVASLNWFGNGFDTSLGDKLVIISYDSATNNITTYLNGVSASVASGWASVSAALISASPTLFANGTNNYRWSGRAYSAALLNKAVTAGEAAKILAFYNNRHQRKYA